MSFQFFNLGYLTEAPSGGDRHLLLLMGALAEQEQVRAVVPSFVASWIPHRVVVRAVPCRPPAGLLSLVTRYAWRCLRGCVEALRTPADYVCASPVLVDLVPALLQRVRFGSRVGVFLFHVPQLDPGGQHESKAGAIRRAIATVAHSWSLRLARSADVVFVGNQLVRRDLLDRGFSAKQLAVHPPALARCAAEVAADEDGADVVFVGRLVKSKGIFDLVQALAPLNATCCMVGSGEEESRLFKAIAQAGLCDRVTLQGAVSDQRLARVLAGARCLALPSYEEGYALVIAEALLADVPVVAYELPHYQEVFGRAIGKGLFLVPPGDVARLSEALDEVLAQHNGAGFGNLSDLLDTPTPDQAAQDLLAAFSKRTVR